jgi:hypothetical protein
MKLSKAIEKFHNDALRLREVRNTKKVLEKEEKLLASKLKDNLPIGITNYGDCVVDISQAKKEVYKALDVLNAFSKDEIAELFDAEIFTVGKGTFEAWAKLKGYDTSNLLTIMDPEDRIKVS